MVTINDVAKAAGVAKSTVSNVLTRKKFVSEELSKKVLKVCNDLHFVPNFYASGLPGRKTNILGLLLEAKFNFDKNSFVKDLIFSCLQESVEHGYSLLLYSNDDKDKLFAQLHQGASPIAGAVVLGPCVNDERLTEMKNTRTKCVVIGRPNDNSGIGSVDVDNSQLVKDVVNKLIKEYSNNVYLLNSSFEMTISQDRNEGFKEVCAENGLDATGRIFESVNSTIEDGYIMSKDIIQKDAIIITANAKMAEGVYRRIEEQGLKVGKDVAVFALGRSKEHGYFSPKLSYARQDYSILGKTAINLLIDEIENKNVMNKRVNSELIFTESTQR